MTWNKQKEILKTQFIRKHQTECDKAFAFKNYKTTEGHILINIARKELNYSAKTSDCDIFYGLRKVYKQVL